jgi:hypothetical protein
MGSLVLLDELCSGSTRDKLPAVSAGQERERRVRSD